MAIFDCDHVPTRSFLQMTMGWFLKEKQLAGRSRRQRRCPCPPRVQ
ncbi:hypothetical protein MJN85_29860 [Salmonella enterica subsp. enterica serovar Anatum]|nr:hypothetical protein [Salmonella enterica subsp. enterica serovar Anatum]